MCIQQALTSNDLNSIRCSILRIQPSITCDNQGYSTTSTFILIGDESGTTYLVAINLKQDEIKLEQSYTMTDIRKKNLNGSSILSTTRHVPNPNPEPKIRCRIQLDSNGFDSTRFEFENVWIRRTQGS